MNILVCLKQILDPEIPARDFRVDPVKLEAERGAANLVTNIFCENALETALQFRDAHGGKITALSCGPAGAEDVLRKALALKADDPNVLFVATGDGALGSTGAIQRSRDGGRNWQMLPLPVEPNSPIWAFAVHRADPQRVLACSHYGEVFASNDAGDSWVKLRREFSEIRALAWTPS